MAFRPFQLPASIMDQSRRDCDVLITFAEMLRAKRFTAANRRPARPGSGRFRPHWQRPRDRAVSLRVRIDWKKVGIVRFLKRVRPLAWAGAAWAMMASSAAQASLADPAGSGVIVGAVRWLEGTLLGTIATVVAVIAVASVGLLMLTGRINWRYGATVIIGCFILFGAASIVGGIQQTAQAVQ